MPRNHYSAEIRQYAISSVLNSQTPVAQVAQEVGCSVHSLHSWLKKHRQQNSPSAEHPTEATFVPVKILGSANHSAEIVMTTGITIRLSNISPQLLAELVHALVPSC